MKIAKRFRWEAAHRLPWHEGECRHLHGHSYRMYVEVEGDVDDRGILLDFKDLKSIVSPIVDAFDHSTLVAESDQPLSTVLFENGWKHVLLPFETTAENLCAFIAGRVAEAIAASNDATRIRSVRVRIAETGTCYAETEQLILVAGGDGAASPVYGKMPIS